MALTSAIGQQEGDLTAQELELLRKERDLLARQREGLEELLLGARQQQQQSRQQRPPSPAALWAPPPLPPQQQASPSPMLLRGGFDGAYIPDAYAAAPRETQPAAHVESDVPPVAAAPVDRRRERPIAPTGYVG